MDSVLLAFAFGFALTMLPLLRSGMAIRPAMRLAFAADLLSITLMEIVDNAAMLSIPGAMDAGLDEPLFWLSMAAALALAGIAAYPLNRYLVRRGRGHALVHSGH